MYILPAGVDQTRHMYNVYVPMLCSYDVICTSNAPCTYSILTTWSIFRPTLQLLQLQFPIAVLERAGIRF